MVLANLLQPKTCIRVSLHTPSLLSVIPSGAMRFLGHLPSFQTTVQHSRDRAAITGCGRKGDAPSSGAYPSMQGQKQANLKQLSICTRTEGYLPAAGSPVREILKKQSSKQPPIPQEGGSAPPTPIRAPAQPSNTQQTIHLDTTMTPTIHSQVSPKPPSHQRAASSRRRRGARAPCGVS